MKIIPVPCLEDNYAYLIIDEVSKDAAAVDPVKPGNVMEAAKAHDASIKMVLTTHRHWDHAGGNNDMKQLIKDLKLYGGVKDSVDACTNFLEDGDEFVLTERIKIQALHTPCHTKGHICYYVTDSTEEHPSVFTGDTLFIAGCGKFFEGSPADMYHSLCNKLALLPPTTRVYCGHEYTEKNLRFALTVEPENIAMKKKLEWVRQQKEDNKPTVPSTIKEELDINPFMRVDLPVLKEVTGHQDPIEVLATIRKLKDKF